MKIEVRFHHLQLSEALRDHASRRAWLQLSRFGAEVVTATLGISDVNGPKGGVDKRCRVALRVRRGPSVVLEELSADAYAAVDLAVERAARALGRQLERGRGRTRAALGRERALDGAFA